MPLFTKETAAVAGKKGAIARWTPKPSPPLSPVIPRLEADPYASNQAFALRCEIARLLDLQRKTNDPEQVDKFSRAIDRLSRHEAALSGRPSPGSLRPRSHKPEAPAMIYLPPEPIPQIQDQPNQTEPIEAGKESLIPAPTVVALPTATPAQ